MSAVSRRDNDDTRDDGNCTDHYPILPSEEVADDADGDLAENRADSERVGETSRDGRGVGLAVDLAEENVRQLRGEKNCVSKRGKEQEPSRQQESRKKAYGLWKRTKVSSAAG